jgi:hypothetical protein
MSLLFDHPLIAFVLWTLLSVGFGLALGAVIRHADAAQESQPALDDATQLINWNERPAAWL